MQVYREAVLKLKVQYFIPVMVFFIPFTISLWMAVSYWIGIAKVRKIASEHDWPILCVETTDDNYQVAITTFEGPMAHKYAKRPRRWSIWRFDGEGSLNAYYPVSQAGPVINDDYNYTPGSKLIWLDSVPGSRQFRHMQSEIIGDFLVYNLDFRIPEKIIVTGIVTDYSREIEFKPYPDIGNQWIFNYGNSLKSQVAGDSIFVGEHLTNPIIPDEKYPDQRATRIWRYRISSGEWEVTHDGEVSNEVFYVGPDGRILGLQAVIDGFWVTEFIDLETGEVIKKVEGGTNPIVGHRWAGCIGPIGSNNKTGVVLFDMENNWTRYGIPGTPYCLDGSTISIRRVIDIYEPGYE